MCKKTRLSKCDSLGQKMSLFLVLFLCAFVLNGLHMLGCNKLDIVFLCPINASLKDYGKEYTWCAKERRKRLVGELYFIICAICGITYRFKRCLTYLKKLCAHSCFSVEPEILGVTVTVVNGKGREVLCLYTVDNSICILFLFEEF